MKLLIVAVGQRVPDWAQTAYDDYAKRFPPELKVELKAVKTEPRGSKTLETLYAAERERIEAAIPRGTRVVALDERGSALTTAALALALPVMWLQHNIVDADGYAALAQRAASDPALQQAVAGELTSQIGNLASADVSTAVVGALASSYTGGSSFPGQFAQANRLAHRWMFTNSVQSQLDSQGRWVVDLAPMLADSSPGKTVYISPASAVAVSRSASVTPGCTTAT